MKPVHLQVDSRSGILWQSLLQTYGPATPVVKGLHNSIWTSVYELTRCVHFRMKYSAVRSA